MMTDSAEARLRPTRVTRRASPVASPATRTAVQYTVALIDTAPSMFENVLRALDGARMRHCSAQRGRLTT